MPEHAVNVLETLRESGEFTMYRGQRQGDPFPVLAVALTVEHPSPQSLWQLEHEYALAAELDSAWAVTPLALTRHEGQTILVLKDPGGEPLDRVLERGPGQPLDLTRVLRIAIGLAAALGDVHRRGLIHKDIKPANMFVDDDGHVWLTGFGIASRRPRERQAPAPPESIAGTLAYMAPEQTGRMNRSIDARSDLYSVGITLYQMLTGALPFAAADALEWVHCHVARQPIPPGDRAAIPEPLSSLTMKLLTKNAEDRYQTAAGLEADLRRCLAEWQSNGRIDPFPLGAHDTSDQLLIPEKLYGREREIDALLAAFDRVVANGTSELVLVSGDSGVGKSSVVNELHKVLVRPRGLFAAGKFDQYKRDIPYSTLAQAFQDLVRLLLGKSEGELARWRDALREALGPNGQLMVDLVPELKLIIGNQAPVPELPPQDAQRRFQLVFRRFLSVFARPEHPLALFLDDLQWLDAATLDLLEDLLTQPDVRHLALIGAYRDNEVTPTHPLMRRLDAIRNGGARVQEIVLTPLTGEDVSRLIADSLHCDRERAVSLAQLVLEKTDGNPFFVIQFLSAMVEEGLLTFDHGAGRWSWVLTRIHAKGYTDNVVDLMVGKLSRLPINTQEVLRQFACLGNSAECALLAMLREGSTEALDRDLEEALRAGLVLPSGDSYRFLHDRVQEAVYSQIPEAERAETHLRIGRLLAAHTSPQRREETIFEIVNQLNRGAALITAPDEREQLAELNLVAAQRARASAAYASALTYLVAGAELLPEDGWERRHDLMFALALHRAECEYVTGQLGPAEERLITLATHAATIVEQAAVAGLRVDLYVALDQADRAIAVGLEYLRHLGVEWSPHPTAEDAQREYAPLISKLGTHAIDDLIDLPALSDPASLATLEILTKLATPAFVRDKNLLVLVSCRAVDLSLERGNCDASCFAYVWLAIASVRFGDYQTGYRLGRLADELVERHGWKRVQERIYHLLGALVLPWTKPIRMGRDLLRRALEAATTTGDAIFAAATGANINSNLLMAGDHLTEVAREAERGLDFARTVGFGLIVDMIAAQLGLVRSLRGSTRTLGSFDDDQFDERQAERRFSSNPNLQLAECWYWIRKLQARFLAGDGSAAVEASQQAERLLWTVESLVEQAEYHFYGALARALCCDSAPADERQAHQAALAAHQRQLEIWAQNCPENFENRAALVGAEIARIEGRLLDAERLYEAAIKSARENGFVHNEALANELAARFYAARGFETIWLTYLRNARYGYLRWGADGKVKQLDARYPHLHEERAPTSLTATVGTPVGQLDVETVVKASQALSSEIVLPTLIETLMRIAVEHAGAERGLLILLRGDEPHIEAEATTRHGRAEVTVRQTAITPSDLPQSALQYVMRTRERVILDDASVRNLYSEDEYVRRTRPRSVLCLPIVKQTKLVGALYLENNLTPSVFTSDRVAVLELLASQAAISLENANLYSDLQRSEAAIRASERSLRLIIDTIPGFVGTLSTAGAVTLLNRQVLDYFGKTAEDLKNWASSDVVHPDDLPRVIDSWRRSVETGQPYENEHRYRRADGAYRWFHSRALPARDSEGRITDWYMLLTDIDDRKHAQEKLQRSEAFLAEAQGISHTGSFGWRVSTGEILWSEETFRIFQYAGTMTPSVDLILQRVHPDDAALVQQTIERASQDGKDFGFEHRLLMPDGSIKHLRVVGHAERDQSGELEFVGAVMDVTAAKEAEERIRQDERELGTAIETIPALVLSFLPDGTVDFVSDRWLDYVGLSREEMFSTRKPLSPTLGGAWQSTNHPDDLDRALNKWQAALATGEPLELETRYRRADGQYRWFLVRSVPLRDEIGKIVKWYATYVDIEERKQAEDKLRRSEAYLAEAQRVSHTGSWAVNVATGEATHSSEEASRLFGFDPARGAPSMQEFRERVHPEDRDRSREAFDRAIGEQTDYEMDYRAVLPDGTIKYLHTIGHPAFNAAGDLVEYVGTSMDVTERRQAEDSVRQAQAELAHIARVSTMGEMAASIAHEVDQPLSGVVINANACLRFLRSAPPNLDEVRDGLQAIARDGQRASDVVARIRALARRTVTEKGPVDINEVIREVVALAEGEVRSSRARLRTELAGDLPRVLGDRVELQQVVLNLLLNGLDAMHAVEGRPRELVISTQREASDGVRVAVQDSGSGIDPQFADRIFEAFYTSKRDGLGMGLSISRSIVEQHGGRLWAAPNDGPGTTFYFTV